MNNCTNCGADLSVMRMAACCSNPHEDAALNALADERAGGPFVPVALGDLDAPQQAEPADWDALAEFKSSADFARKAYSHVVGDIKGRTASVGKHQAVNHEHLRRIYEEAKEAFPRFADTLAWLLWHNILKFDRLAMLVENYGLRVPAPAPTVPVEGAPYRIWAWEGDGQDGWDNAYATTHHVANDQVEYVRADIVALRAQPAPQVKALVDAANALIDFNNGPAQAKRPDVYQRLMQRIADALSALSGESHV